MKTSDKVLEVDVIQRLLRRELMQESAKYQLMKNQAIAESLQEGIKEGVRPVALKFLNEGLTQELVVRVTGLSLEQVQEIQATGVENEDN